MYLLSEHIHLLALGFNSFKFTPFMQVDKDYSAYQQNDYRIADGDVFAQRCNAFVFVIAHKLFLSNSSPSENGGLLVPHTASLRCEAGVFLSKLILLPNTYSRSAWEFSEHTATQCRIPYNCLFALYRRRVT